MDTQRIPNYSQPIKPFTPIVALRERARAAYQAQIESEAAERAEAFAAGQRNAAARLVQTCAELFHLTIDPADVVTEITRATVLQPATIRARVVVDGIELSWSWSQRNPPSERLLALVARALCPCCGAPLSAESRVSRLAHIGALLGEVGCECGWMPGEVTA